MLDSLGRIVSNCAARIRLITDPIFLADVYNVNDDPVAGYLGTTGVFVGDFGGDESCAVWWQEPFLLLPLSLHLPHDPATVAGAVRIVDEVGCDSGSFLFLPIRDDQPAPVGFAVNKVLAKWLGARIQLPPGRYQVFYEQHNPPKGLPLTFGRNIVVCRQR